jgi:hypothetical protein
MFGMIIYASGTAHPAGEGVLHQSGGFNEVDMLLVRGTYRITGGTFQVNRDLTIEPGGTIDFGNGLGALAAGNNSLIQMPTHGLANTASATLVGKPGSLINYQPGHDPRDQFGDSQIDGLIHEQGTPLHIPSDKSVTGAGLIVGNTTNDGEVHPGYGVGRLDVTGSYMQTDSATLFVQIGETDSGLNDLLAVSGAATLDGLLHVSLFDGYRPLASDFFHIVQAGSITGRFDNAQSQVITGNVRFDVLYTSSGVTLRNFAFVPEPASAAALFGLTLLAHRRRR